MMRGLLAAILVALVWLGAAAGVPTPGPVRAQGATPTPTLVATGVTPTPTVVLPPAQYLPGVGVAR